MWIVVVALLSAAAEAAIPNVRIVHLGVEECPDTLSAARQAYEAREYRDASTLFARALGECGASEALLLALAQAQLLSQDVPRALATIDRVLALDPKHVPALKVKAKALYLAAMDRQAEEALQSAATLAPADAEILYDLGRIYYQQQRFEDAAGSFRKAITLDPRAYKAWDSLGLATEALGDTGQATRCYLKAIEIVHKDHPDYDVVYANFADLLIKSGDARTAFDLSAEAAGRNPGDARNFFLTGKALVRLDQPAVAVRWLEQAIVLDPDYPAPRYLLAQVYRRLGRVDQANEALAAFQAAAARAPKRRRE